MLSEHAAATSSEASGSRNESAVNAAPSEPTQSVPPPPPVAEVIEPVGLAPQVSAEQERAIVLMGSGRSMAETAREAGVGRATLYRWLREDPKFIAAWNAWRAEVAGAARARLLGVADEAVSAVRQAVARGDARLALELLKSLGLLTAEPPAPDDPEVVSKQRELDRRATRAKLNDREQDVTIAELTVPGSYLRANVAATTGVVSEFTPKGTRPQTILTNPPPPPRPSPAAPPPGTGPTAVKEEPKLHAVRRAVPRG